jgi:hypothetical protein
LEPSKGTKKAPPEKIGGATVGQLGKEESLSACFSAT